MKNQDGKSDTLDGILDKIWLMLEHGATHPDCPIFCSIKYLTFWKPKGAARILWLLWCIYFLLIGWF